MRWIPVVRDNARRALIIAALVGTTLVLINHGDHIQMEPVCPHFFAKAGLCYVVPFLVSLVSALFAAHDRNGKRPPPT